MRYWLAALLALATAAAQAQEPQPFVHGSAQAIAEAHRGRPFVLALWSLDCVYCRPDLALLGELKARHPRLDLVIVATDPSGHARETEAVLEQLGLGGAPSWIFADDFVERLRFEIDRQWSGELPRTYFYDADGSRAAVSGKLDAEQVGRWIAAAYAEP